MTKMNRALSGVLLMAVFCSAAIPDACGDSGGAASCGFLDNGGTFTTIRGPGAFTLFNVPGGNGTLVSGLNDGGQIVRTFAPEPDTFVLLGIGVIGLVGTLRRRNCRMWTESETLDQIVGTRV